MVENMRKCGIEQRAKYAKNRNVQLMLLSSYVFCELHAINGVYDVWYRDDIEIDALSHLSFGISFSALYSRCLPIASFLRFAVLIYELFCTVPIFSFIL